jgi:hypothetical protein
MKLEKRKPSGREKDEDAIRLLEKLRQQLYFPNLTAIRQSAFHLSWLQEDGLDILKEALFSNSSRKTKSAAAYGLRKMRGRMAKMAIEVLKEGTKHSNNITATTCENALKVLNQKGKKKRPSSKKKRHRPRFEIRDIPAKNKKKTSRSRRYMRHSIQ